ncbi:MAG: (deoxy)nucleoside triphosphate pyrophosphohydrolase [Bacteroidia bacterium]
MIVCCAIIEQKGKILLAQRKSSQKFGDKWEFPGGKQEPGESAEACLLREIREELHISITLKHRLPDFPLGLAGTLIPFLCEIEAGSITLVDHQAVEWVIPENLLDYELSPADVPVAEYVIQAQVK